MKSVFLQNIYFANVSHKFTVVGSGRFRTQKSYLFLAILIIINFFSLATLIRMNASVTPYISELQPNLLNIPSVPLKCLQLTKVNGYIAKSHPNERLEESHGDLTKYQ